MPKLRQILPTLWVIAVCVITVRHLPEWWSFRFDFLEFIALLATGAAIGVAVSGFGKHAPFIHASAAAFASVVTWNFCKSVWAQDAAAERVPGIHDDSATVWLFLWNHPYVCTLVASISAALLCRAGFSVVHRERAP